MKILQIVADGAPGGGTTSVLTLSEGLGQRGVDVVFVSQKDSYALQRAEEAGMETHGVHFFRSRFDPRVPRRLRGIIQETRPDAVHAHGGRAGFFCSFLRLPHPPPLAYTARGHHFQGKPWGLRHLGILAERRTVHAADAAVHLSQADKRLTTECGIAAPDKPQACIPNGLDLAAIPPAVDTDLRLVALFGRLTFPKDPMLFLETMRLLAPEGFRGVMIGGGDMEHAARRRIRELLLEGAVRITGALPRTEALEVLRPAGTMVLPSRWEGLPLAPIEAMAMGVPVVAARVCGLPDVVEDGQSGFLLEERKPEAYAERVRALAADPSLRSRIIAAARRRVEERFTAERVVEDHLALYRALIAGRAREEYGPAAAKGAQG